MREQQQTWVPGPSASPHPSCLRTWPTVTLQFVAICRSSNSLGVQSQKERPTQPKSKNTFAAASKPVKIPLPSPGPFSKTAHSAYVSGIHQYGMHPRPQESRTNLSICVNEKLFRGHPRHFGKCDPVLIKLCALAHRTWAQRLGQHPKDSGKVDSWVSIQTAPILP